MPDACKLQNISVCIYSYQANLKKKTRIKRSKFLCLQKKQGKNKIFVLHSAYPTIKMINVRPKVSQSYFCFSNFLRKKGAEMSEM